MDEILILKTNRFSEISNSNSGEKMMIFFCFLGKKMEFSWKINKNINLFSACQTENINIFFDFFY